MKYTIDLSEYWVNGTRHLRVIVDDSLRYHREIRHPGKNTTVQEALCQVGNEIEKREANYDLAEEAVH